MANVTSVCSLHVFLLAVTGALPLEAQVSSNGTCEPEGVVVAGVLTEGTSYDHAVEYRRGGYREMPYSLECVDGQLLLKLEDSVMGSSPVLAIVDPRELYRTFEVTFSQSSYGPRTSVFAIQVAVDGVYVVLYFPGQRNMTIRSGLIAFVGPAYRDLIPMP